MKNSLLGLLLLLGLSFAKPCFAQTLTNTDDIITLTGTCLNGQLSSGSYTLNLSYVDLDNGPTSIGPVSVSVVVVNSSTATLTLPSGTLPTPETDGYWSLADTNGSLVLTGGAGGGPMYWYQNADGTQGFNCTPLGISSSLAAAWRSVGRFIGLQ